MKRNALMLLCLLLFVSLMACSSSKTNTTNTTKDTSPAKPGNSAAEKEKITIKYSFWGDTDTKDLHLQVVDAFMKENPHITVEPVHIASDYLTKIQTNFAGGSAPDVINLSTSDVTTFAAQGVLSPITELMERDWDKANLGDNFPRIMEALEWNGEQYALPRNGSGRTLYYNKDLFDKAGVPYPDETWTWETFVEMGKKLTNNESDPNKKVYAIGFEGEDSNVHTNFVWQAGGDYFDGNGNFTLNSKEARQGLQYLHDLIYKHQIAPNPSTYTSMKPREMFFNQKIAMFIESGYMIAMMQDKEFNWDVALLPKGPVNRESAIAPTGLVIPTTSKHKEEAWEFIKFVNDSKGQEILISNGFSAPVRKSILEDQSKYLPPENFKVSRDIAITAYSEFGRVKPKHPLWTQSDAIMKKNLQMYFLNQVDLDSTLTQIDDNVKSLVKK